MLGGSSSDSGDERDADGSGSDEHESITAKMKRIESAQQVSSIAAPPN